MRQLPRAAGAALVASVLLVLAPAASAVSAASGARAARPESAPNGGVTTSRVTDGECTRLVGLGFAAHERLVLSDNGRVMRSVQAGPDGALDTQVCFDTSVHPGAQLLTASSAPNSAHQHSVSSMVYLVGASAPARSADLGASDGSHVRQTAEFVGVVVLAVPLLLLVAAAVLLIRAARRARARRRMANDAKSDDLLIDAHAEVRSGAERRRSVGVALVAGAAVIATLAVAYAAARCVHVLDAVDRATSALSRAASEAAVADTQAANADAVTAANEARKAQADQRDPVFRALALLPGLDATARSIRDVTAATVAASTDVSLPWQQGAPAAQAQITPVQRIPLTGWRRVDAWPGRLAADLYTLASRTPTSELSALRSPMLRPGRRYLVLVQDDRRSRATGGLVVATGVLSVRGSTLALTQTEPADSSWGTVNLTPDFPTVAAGAAAAWRRRTGVAVDGVLAVDEIALQQLGATPSADPVAALRSAFTALQESAADTARLAARAARASVGGHVQLWSAHPAEEGLLATAPLGGALVTRPPAYVEVVTQGVSNQPVDGQVYRRISYQWRPTGMRQNLGKGLEPVDNATVTIRLDNRSAAAQQTWLTAYFNRGTGVVAATVDGRPWAMHTAEEKGSAAVAFVLELRPRAITTVVLRVVQPTPGGRPPVYVQQPRISTDSWSIGRV